MFEMAAIEGVLTFSPESIVEDVLQEHAEQCPNDYFDVRRVEEEVIRRYEATAWLRQMVGVIGEKDLPAKPCEEEFRRGLRSGIILCKTLNKIQTGAVQKVVENPCDTALLQDGAALSAYQYFENLRNFLSAVQEMGLPTFDASDLEEGGKSARVVNCILALKSYSEWKKAGGQGVWRYGGNMKPIISGKRFVRKTSEPFTSCLLRTIAVNEKTLNHSHTEKDLIGVPSSSLSKLLRAILVDKKSEEVPNLVESVLHKVMEQLEPHVSRQTDPKKTNSVDSNIGNICMPTSSLPRNKIEEKNDAVPNTDLRSQKNKCTGGSECRFAKQQVIVSRQHKDLKVLKQTLSSTKAGMQLMQMKFHEEIKKLGMHLHRLAHAASSYHRVLEENRKLYNQVQDLKGSIRVYCRVRPFLTGQCNYFSTVDHIDEGTITINTLLKSGKGQKIFSFNKVFGPSATQDEVFADTQPLVRSVLDGYNVCIFAYGQTGSGKTYTMTGPNDINQRSQGVNYRSLSDLFLLVEQRKDSYFYDISVQMIEIYNEQVRDLLVTDGLSKRLEIRNNSQIGFSVPEANLVHVSSTFDVINLMNLGQSNRAVGTTALNDRSSRSHSCLTVHVQGRDLTSGNVLRGCMHLVDLAGSERVDKSEVTGDRLKEAQHINRSLSALGDVISSLAQKNSHVPYRNSKLTQLLQYSLGGQAKTLMFVHISPEPDAIGETISTLKFAERVASVELGTARVNKDSAHVKELKEQIAVLRAALARKDGEPVSTQHKVSGSRCKMHPSPIQSTSNAKDCGLASPIGLRKPMEEVGNIEIFENSAPMQKKQVLDSNELLRNSPMWSPVRSSCQTKGDYDREVESAGLVDKLMVKHDHLAVDNHLSCQNQDHNSDANIVDVLAQKYLLDPSTYSLEKQCGPLSNTADEQAELNAGSSDSSEQDFLLQFNHSKLGCYVAGLKAEKRCAVVDNSPKFRSMIPKLVHSSPRKAANGAGQAPRRIGRQSVETKHKARNKK